MKWGNAGLRARVWVSPRVNQANNGRYLRSGIPLGRTWSADCGRMERFIAEAVPRIHTRAGCHELLCDFRTVCRRGKMQGRIAGVNVLSNFGEEVWLFRLARGAGRKTHPRQCGRSAEE